MAVVTLPATMRRMDPHILAFVGVAALLTISPGPDMAVMLKNVLRGGRRVVVPTALGTCAGLFAWGAGSSLGIAALVAASAELYAALRLVGAAYLAYLGVLALRSAIRGDPAADDAGPAPRPDLARGTAFRQGLLTNLLNPKVGVFYATLLPQFIPPGAPVFGTSILLAAIHAGLCLVWLIAYGWGIALFGGVLRGGAARRRLEAITGLVLLAFGLRIATEAR
jgi:threonine/homoserine/homoserine lactone efflux protein